MNHTQRVPLVFCLLIAACGGDGGGPGQLNQVPGPDALSAGDLCRGVVDRCADEGARECTAEGARECVELGGCLQWGFAQACAPGTRCDGGACVAGCAGQACTALGATKCDPSASATVLHCDDVDGDGCLEWGAPDVCNAPLVCSLGACADHCVDACADGAAKCEGDAVVTCGDSDGDGCLSWGVPAPCVTGACALGQCAGACQDACDVAGLTGCDGGGVVSCERGGDGCLRWGTASACPAGTTCSSGACAALCVDECAVGATDCAAGGVRGCGQFDADPCREWGVPAACGVGTTCSEGVCTASCISECTTAGARGCGWEGLRVRECGDWDADPCLEWADVATCGAQETCSLGACSATCVDECDAGERRCRAGSTTRVEACQDGDADPCLEWAEVEDCATSARVCDGGLCAASCMDDCQAASCEAGRVVPCGQLDADACLDAGTPLACAAWQTCEAGACVAAPALPGLVVSEVLYNAEGFDYDVFVELHGPAGASLAGYALYGVNGSGGGDYAEIALTGALDSAGFYLVAHPWAVPRIADVADQLTFLADLQNGPDSVQLRFGPTTVDALGYGEFAAGDVFAGEGTPAASVVAGHSLARDGDFSDTGDNVVDFHDQEVPTPAAPPLTAVAPLAAGDIVFTEVMADPKALPDDKGEWFELHNPGAITRTLAGCELDAGGNDLHTVAALEIAPGAYVTLARSAAPGFVPGYVYANLGLTNSGDALDLRCGGVAIDGATWAQAPTGQALQRDLVSGAWCAATVAYNGNDTGTPGAANPPCATSGTYDQTLADSDAGICTLTSNWNYLTYTSTQPATEDADLEFEWFVAWCATFGQPGHAWVEFKVGGTWTPVAEADATSSQDACTWLFETQTIPKATINGARTASGTLPARFRVQSGCALGILCGAYGGTVPTNCARRLRLTYSH